MLERDPTLCRIFKDLFIARKEILDLKQSIASSLASIKELNGFVKPYCCCSCQQQVHPAFPHECEQVHPFTFKCTHCLNYFATIEHFNQHILTHPKCRYCGEHFSSTSDRHHSLLCPEQKVGCPFCGTSIPKRSANGHILQCSFRQCYRCKQTVFAELYSFHLTQCNLKQCHPSSQCLNLKQKPIKKPMVNMVRKPPCSVMIKNE